MNPEIVRPRAGNVAGGDKKNESLCTRTFSICIFERRTAAPVGGMENRVKAGLAPAFSAIDRIEWLG